MAVELKEGMSADELRVEAAKAKDANQARRLLSLAAIRDGKSRAEAALTAADTLNDRVVPFFDSHDIPVSRVLTDRGTEYCGRPENHEYELYLAIENPDCVSQAPLREHSGAAGGSRYMARELQP